MDANRLARTASRLGEAALRADLWPELLDEIARAVGAEGSALLQSGAPTTDAPWSSSLHRFREAYYRDEWHKRDVRAIRSRSAIGHGLTVFTDEDLVSREEYDRSPYYAFLAAEGLPWFAAVAFRASPSEVWGLVIQRTAAQGPFTARDKRSLALLAPRLTQAAELSQALGRAALGGALAALDHLVTPAFALGTAGAVLGMNAAAAALLDEDLAVRAGRLVAGDGRAGAEILALCGRPGPSAFGERFAPIVVRRPGRFPLVLRPLPVDGPAAGVFLGARILLTVADPAAGTAPPDGLLHRAFGLTAAEARLAARLAEGQSLDAIADGLGIARETARSQLKSTFAKTATSRQAELVALLHRL